MSDNDDDDDGVGYRRPPKAHRFQPEKSGNPRGRPKGAKGLMTKARFQRSLLEFMSEELKLPTSDGQSKKTTRLEILRQALFKAAIGGNTKAAKLLLDLFQEAIPFIMPVTKIEYEEVAPGTLLVTVDDDYLLQPGQKPN